MLRNPILPNLQRIPAEWIGGVIRDDPALLGNDIELHPVCNTPCKTYFYEITERNAMLIRRVKLTSICRCCCRCCRCCCCCCCCCVCSVSNLPLYPNFI